MDQLDLTHQIVVIGQFVKRGDLEPFQEIIRCSEKRGLSDRVFMTDHGDDFQFQKNLNGIFAVATADLFEIESRYGLFIRYDRRDLEHASRKFSFLDGVQNVRNVFRIFGVGTKL